MTQEAAARSRRARRPRRGLLVAALVLLAVVGLGIWGLLAARTAADASREAEAFLQDAAEALQDGDLQRAADAASDAGAHTERARSAVGALPLTLASVLPVVGDDVDAVRTSVAAVDDATRRGVVPVSSGALDLLAAQESAPPGQVDVVALAGFATVVSDAASATASARDRAEAVDPSTLRWVGDPVRSATEGLVDLDDRLATADDAMAAAVPALGGDGPRTYLLAAQNLAEARPTGGIIGSWALLTVDQGAIALSDTGVNDDLASLVGRLPDLPDDVEALYGQDLALSQNVNLSPDFPQAASLLVDLWTEQGRAAPDGVIGMDPVALARVVGATGPVQPPGGPELDGDNLVRVVQDEVYRTYDGRNEERQAYLGVVTASVFDALVGADWSTPELRRAITGSLRDGHLQVWSADPATQQRLVDLGVAGALGAPSEDSPVRVHLTNADASKLDQFLDVSASVSCAGGTPQLVVDLTSTPPAELPEYSRSHVDGLAPRDHRLTLAVFLPPTRGVGALTLDGAATTVSSGTEQGWTVVRVTVDVAADATASAVWTLSGDARVPGVRLQPLTREPETSAATAGDRCDR